MESDAAAISLAIFTYVVEKIHETAKGQDEKVELSHKSSLARDTLRGIEVLLDS